jgi:membrane protein required for colicin V production
MQIVLVLCGLILAFTLVDGFRHGIVRRVVELAGLIAIFLFASRLADALEPSLSEGLGASPTAAFFGSWAIVLVGGVVLLRVVAATISSLLRLSVIGWLDRLGGAVLGLVFGLVCTSLLLIGLLALPVSGSLKQEVRDHPVTRPLLHFAPSLYDAISPLWGGRDFFEMIEERLEPVARKAEEGLRAFLGEGERGARGDD